MARLLGPDDRTVFLTSGPNRGKAAGQGLTVPLYADQALTTPADVLTEAGAVIPGTPPTLIVDANSLVPLFQFPDGVDTVWTSVNGGPATALYVRSDDRMDALSTATTAATANVAAVTTRVGNLESGVYNVRAYGATGNGTTDDTAAFNAALAAMPTRSVSGTLFPVGVLRIPAGTYKVGTTTEITNIGPCVAIQGDGHNQAILAYYGAGRCLEMYNTVKPSSVTFDTIAVWHGRIDGITIDGVNAAAGAVGLQYGDTEGGVIGPDVFIRDFTGFACSTPTGLTLGATGGSGGTFSAGTYSWRITATIMDGCGETLPATVVTGAVGANGTQALSWTQTPGATGYLVYRLTLPGDTSGQLVGSITSGATVNFTDTGTTINSATLPVVPSAGSVGLRLVNRAGWTENIWTRVNVRNCQIGVAIDAGAGGSGNPNGDASHEYNVHDFKVYSWPNQISVALRNGVWFNNGSLKIRLNFAGSSAAQTGTCLYITGRVPVGHVGAGGYSMISNCEFNLQAEYNAIASGGGSNGPMTIRFGNNNNNILNGTGVISFNTGAGWQFTNLGSSNRENIQFSGIVAGETTLNPANNSLPVTLGGTNRVAGKSFTDGTLKLNTGDDFTTTLSANVTMVLQNASAAPSTKRVLLKQDGTGGRTVTWPKPGSPTLAAPAVYWPGGTAPTMTATANAVDSYTLHTVDGIRWYGTASQNLS